MTFRDIKDASNRGAVALVPAGCTEQQGPHLPVGFDTWFADRLVLDASIECDRRGIETIVLPALPFGPTPEHRGFGAGYIDLPNDVHEAVITAILRSLVQQGFRRILVWRGCGGHDLQKSIDEVRGEVEKVVIVMPSMPFDEMWRRLGDPMVPGGHADSFTTSIALALWPSFVREDLVPGPSAMPDWNSEPLDFTQWSDTGVIGDARFASAELGLRLHAEGVTWLADQVQELHRRIV
jgi:creatinine amidohydrolase